MLGLDEIWAMTLSFAIVIGAIIGGLLLVRSAIKHKYKPWNEFCQEFNFTRRDEGAFGVYEQMNIEITSHLLMTHREKGITLCYRCTIPEHAGLPDCKIEILNPTEAEARTDVVDLTGDPGFDSMIRVHVDEYDSCIHNAVREYFSDEQQRQRWSEIITQHPGKLFGDNFVIYEKAYTLYEINERRADEYREIDVLNSSDIEEGLFIVVEASRALSSLS